DALRRHRDLLPRDRDHLHRPGAAGRLAPGRRDRGDHGRDRRFVRAAPAEEGLGRTGPAEAVKRFWKEVAVAFEGSGSGWSIALDERPVRTPGRGPLLRPTK